ncbi:MAG TPA: DUF4838 domain-containing protein [Candidatus Binataceae bacterium]|nr:DUF4838 domain-containing protein [Candidatus Binataceae bacterium]
MGNSGNARKLPRIRHAANPGAVTARAIAELQHGLGAMLGGAVASESAARLDDCELRVELGADGDLSLSDRAFEGDAFEIAREQSAIVLRAGRGRGLLHAAAHLLESLGAQFPVGAAAAFPRVDPARLASVVPCRVEPAFARRALVSDIMTWNYTVPDRLALHLAHDREFIPWMARRGLNAFEYIRHAHDTELRIAALAPEFRSHGIGAEYGGHVLPTLMPRERYERNPEYFPAGDDGKRLPHGNLCVANREALALVADGALRYVDEFPENELLHVWGADVRRGAWCRCGECRERAPQLQYMEIVNAIAERLGSRSDAPPVAYLAYHDTIEPHRGLNPRDNVWFEWAPRERCYVHAIDDPACKTNPRYFESLQRYLEIFGGRGHVFEYYADAILFGGLGFAFPEVVARDMAAYHRLGLRSASCLTFGAYSTLSYPVNLDAFVRASRSLDVDPSESLRSTAGSRHVACAGEMSGAYRAIARASHLVLDYGDVIFAGSIGPECADRKRAELHEASRIFRDAISAAESVAESARDPLVGAERELWSHSSEVLAGLSEWLAARAQEGELRRNAGAAAISKVADAIEHIRAIDPNLKGTWGAFDLPWIREFWLKALRDRLEPSQRPAEELI